MKNLRTIRRLSTLLLISVCAASASVNGQSQPDKSLSLSPVKTNALALISELEKPSNCSPDETLCLAEILQRRLESAIAGLRSIVRIDEQREGVIADMQSRIDIRGGIIDDLKKVDSNSQRIDTVGQDSKRLYEEQHRDDKDTIGDLQQSLDACRSNQKWIALGSAIGGGYVGYKLRGSGVAQAPFSFFPTSAAQFQMSQGGFVNLQSQEEQRLKQALKNLRK